MQNGPEYLYAALDFVAKGKIKVITETYNLDEAPKAVSILSKAKPASERFSPCNSHVRAKRRT
jgi:D-arabinose 1-dehydrogenase-like Zn-dependent alcohol dehydrogenase